MAFGKKKHRYTKVILIILGFIVIISGLTLGAWKYHKQQLDLLDQEYSINLQNLQLEIYAMNREVFISNKNLEAGTILSEGLMEKVIVHSDLNPLSYFDEDDIGKVALITIPEGMPITKNMVYEEVITDDLREEVFSMILLSSQLKINDTVDVRICYPNGEDYIVLSKKQIRDLLLEQNTVWMWLDEMEILTINSAIIDAYLHPGTKLYTVSYIEPNLQKEAEMTYPVNLSVLEIIKTNPNILEEAKISLTDTARTELDGRLSLMLQENSEKIEQGVISESQTLQENIQKQEEASLKDEIPDTTNGTDNGTPIEIEEQSITQELSEDVSDESFY